MTQIIENINALKAKVPDNVTLVAVSKTKPISDVQQAYDAGQRVFGENKIQEMTQKWEVLPKDIQWHMIGHVQTNKVKYMAAYVDLIHAVDSFKLLSEINKHAQKNNRIINCLLQLKIAKEDSKHGLSLIDLTDILEKSALASLKNIRVVGLMGMATFTNDENQVRNEFEFLKKQFDTLQIYNSGNVILKQLSMGMSGDYEIAIKEGSTMVRIGSSIFGKRDYQIQ